MDTSIFATIDTTKLCLRIAGYGSRDLGDPQQAAAIATAVAAYYED